APRQDDTGFGERHLEQVAQPAAGMEREQPAEALKPTGHLAKIIDDDGREVHQAVPLVLHVAEGSSERPISMHSESPILVGFFRTVSRRALPSILRPSLAKRRSHCKARKCPGCLYCSGEPAGERADPAVVRGANVAIGAAIGSEEQMFGEE